MSMAISLGSSTVRPPLLTDHDSDPPSVTVILSEPSGESRTVVLAWRPAAVSRPIAMVVSILSLISL